MALLNQLALGSIHFYQRHLSKHKGFRCAHAALHGGESCSAAVAQIIREDGLVGGQRRIVQRFADCRAAHDSIRGGSPLAIGSSPRVRGVCCCGPIPIPFRCG